MAKTVVGLFDRFEDAQEAVRELVEGGFDRNNISLVLNDAEGRHASELGVDAQAADEENEVATGAGTGAAIGGIGGLLVGLGLFLVPGIGPILGAGPLLAALGGAGIGAAVGGMVGALTEAGVPDRDANIYTEGVRQGGTLVMAYVDDASADRAADLLNRHHPVDIEERAANWGTRRAGPQDVEAPGERPRGWGGFNEQAEEFAFDRTHEPDRSPDQPTGPHHERAAASQLDFGRGARAYIAGQPVRDYDRSQAGPGNEQDRSEEDRQTDDDWRMYESRFMAHFDQRYGGVAGGRWEDYREFYRFGYDRGREGRYANADWDAIRGDLRRDWESRFRDRRWEDYEDAVHQGWETGRVPR